MEVVDPRPSDFPRDVIQGAEVVEVLAAREFPVQAAIAHQHAADRRPDHVLLPEHVVHIDPRAPGRRQKQGREAFDQRRLAGTVRAQEAEDLSVVDGEVQVIERLNFLLPSLAFLAFLREVRLRKMVDADDRFPHAGERVTGAVKRFWPSVKFASSRGLRRSP